LTLLDVDGVRFSVADDGLRDIQFWGHQALDAIYVAVRDDSWGTYQASVRVVDVARRPGGVTVTLRGEHGGDNPVFTWDGLVDIEPGSLRLAVRGRMLHDLTSRRIGICLLHPLDLVGHAFRTESATGSFSRAISPGPPASGFRSLRYDAGCPVEIDFDGGLFEMEDHRNWTDAGWKSYSPPLDGSGPRRFRGGEEIVQAVTVRAGAPRVPAIGGFDGLGAYRHVDFVEGEPAPSFATDRPLSVSLVGSSAGWIERTAAHLASAGRIVRVAVFDRDAQTTGAGDAGRVRAVLRELGCAAPVGGGSRLHFAELNRLDAPTDDWDFCAFPVTPQAHHTDTPSIMDTVRAQPYAVEQARRIAPGLPVVVAPLAFRPRTSPGAPAAPGDPVDPREHQPLSAAWLLASVIALHRAEALTVLLDRAAPTTDLLRELHALSGRVLTALDTGRRHLVAAAVSGDRPATLLANIGPDPAEFGSTVVAGYSYAVLSGEEKPE
jgi:hypothetical protein